MDRAHGIEIVVLDFESTKEVTRAHYYIMRSGQKEKLLKIAQEVLSAVDKLYENEEQSPLEFMAMHTNITEMMSIISSTCPKGAKHSELDGASIYHMLTAKLDERLSTIKASIDNAADPISALTENWKKFSWAARRIDRCAEYLNNAFAVTVYEKGTDEEEADIARRKQSVDVYTASKAYSDQEGKYKLQGHRILPLHYIRWKATILDNYKEAIGIRITEDMASKRKDHSKELATVSTLESMLFDMSEFFREYGKTRAHRLPGKEHVDIEHLHEKLFSDPYGPYLESLRSYYVELAKVKFAELSTINYLEQVFEWLQFEQQTFRQNFQCKSTVEVHRSLLAVALYPYSSSQALSNELKRLGVDGKHEDAERVVALLKTLQEIDEAE